MDHIPGSGLCASTRFESKLLLSLSVTIVHTHTHTATERLLFECTAQHTQLLVYMHTRTYMILASYIATTLKLLLFGFLHFVFIILHTDTENVNGPWSIAKNLLFMTLTHIHTLHRARYL